MGWKSSTHINILLSFQEHSFSLIETDMKLKNINGQSWTVLVGSVSVPIPSELSQTYQEIN